MCRLSLSELAVMNFFYRNMALLFIENGKFLVDCSHSMVGGAIWQ